MVSVPGTSPFPGIDARGHALRHPGHPASFRTGVELSRAANSPRAPVTACGRTGQRIRRGPPGLPSGRSLDACTGTGAAEQPEAAARARSPNQLRSRERRRRASPHARRAEMLGISSPSRHRNPATYRVEAGPSASSADSRSPARSAPSACAPQIWSRTEGGGPVIVPEWGSDGGMSTDGRRVGRRDPARMPQISCGAGAGRCAASHGLIACRGSQRRLVRSASAFMNSPGAIQASLDD